MKKIFLNSSISIALALFLTACGGGGSNSMDDNTTQNGNNPSSNQTANSPVIQLKGDREVKLIVGHPYTEDGVTVTGGSFDGEAEVTVDEVDIYKVGEQTITYTVTDKNGKTGTATRTVIIEPIDELLPADTNLKYAKKNNEDGYIYFADPQPDEHGLNRVVRVNYKEMSYVPSTDSLPLTNESYIIPTKDVVGVANSNPHSIDRAGDTNRFYVRTQNCYSFDVVKANPNTGALEYVKTVKLEATLNDNNNTKIPYSPRAFGAYNKKYNIQIVSGRNSNDYTIVGVIDVATDEVIKSIAYPINGTGSATTGHAKWLDEDHFAVVDRGNKMLRVYKVNKDTNGNIVVSNPHEVPTTTPIHTLERVSNPQNEKDLRTFYALGSSAEINGLKYSPMAMKFIFDPNKGNLDRDKNNDINKTDKVAWFQPSDAEKTALEAKNIPLTTHHANITPDGKYLIVPVYNGKIYKIDRDTMMIVQPVLNTDLEKGLGAGHIEFSKSLNLAVITNHWSEYITVIDMSDFTVKKYIKIYEHSHPFDSNNKHLMQPHFAQISEDGKYFYTFASQDNGRFVKVNLETLEVEDSVNVGGAPEQAHS